MTTPSTRQETWAQASLRPYCGCGSRLVPGIISGITMVFVPSLTTFVISNLLGGSKILLIGNVIEQEFTKGSNWNLGSGLSLVLMVFILISMALIAKYDKNGEGSTF